MKELENITTFVLKPDGTIYEESFDYNGWHFEFRENPADLYSLIVVGRKNDKAINWELHFPLPIYDYDIIHSLEYIEKERKKQIAEFKENILKEELL